MSFAVSSVSPNGPTITHYALTRVEVCVPVQWSTKTAIEFTESKWHCLNNYRWTTSDSPDHTVLCEMQHGFKHLTLMMEPASNDSLSTDSTHTTDTPSINARVILNIERDHPDDILKTADSIQLLSEYLQFKGEAAKARTDNHHDEAHRLESLADQLHSRLLGQFNGTLVFV